MVPDNLSAAVLRVLRALAGSQRPMTVAERAGALGGHPNTMRLHLKTLLDDGWVSVLRQPPHGRGRPSKAYAPTVAGRRASWGPSAALADESFVEALAEHLGASPQPGAAAVSIGRRWGARLGATRDHEGLVGALGQGFAAERIPEGLAIRSCPLLDSARRNPDVVCGLHQGLIDALAPEPMTLARFARPGMCLAVPTHA
jgi:predicted ArsR family transcriptional regulator